MANEDLIRRLRTDAAWHRRRGNETIAKDCEEAARALEQAERVPLTREQMRSLKEEAGYTNASAQEKADFINGVRHAERAHGITALAQEPKALK